ncbi:unnamed protein product [Urochloa humidicola]
MFGVVFSDHTFPLDATAFAQVAPNSWLLDLSTLVLAVAPRSAVFFLLPVAAAVLPPGKAVTVYFQAAANHPFAFLGALGPTRPSASFSLPELVAVEDVAVLPPPPDEQSTERVALRVSENLFNFMQSFCGADDGKLVVPTVEAEEKAIVEEAALVEEKPVVEAEKAAEAEAAAADSEEEEKAEEALEAAAGNEAAVIDDGAGSFKEERGRGAARAEKGKGALA